MTLQAHRVARFSTALREGGSLPAIVENEAGDAFVAKWRGAGQGAAALVAEVIVGGLARRVGLPMPGLCTLTLDPVIARNERDQEIRDLLLASEGLNLGMDFLRGALNYDPGAHMPVSAELATRIVVFDALTTNVDRSPRNPNLMWWDGGLWLIDHGAALYWHHGWDGTLARPDRAFPMVRDHVLLPLVDDVRTHAQGLLSALTDDVIVAAVDDVPSSWLPEPVADRRAAYAAFLSARRDAAEVFTQEIIDARASL